MNHTPESSSTHESAWRSPTGLPRDLEFAYGVWLEFFLELMPYMRAR